MRIDSSTMSLSSYSSQTTVTQTTEQLDVWFDSAAQDTPRQLGFDAGAINEIKVQDVDTYEISDSDALKMQLLNKMFEALTGKKLRFYLPEKYRKTASEDSGKLYSAFKTNSGTSQTQGWGIRYQKQEYVQETAQMSFSASGTVKTADGRSIDFSLDLNLSRSFTSTSSTSFAAGTRPWILWSSTLADPRQN